MNTHRVPLAQCPNCRAEHDAATNVEHGVAASPKPGDFTICIECGSTLRFHDAGLQLATRRDLEELPPETRAHLLRAQQFLARSLFALKGSAQ